MSRIKAKDLVRMLTEAPKSAIIHSETSPVLTWAERPLRDVAVPTAKATQKNLLCGDLYFGLMKQNLKDLTISRWRLSSLRHQLTCEVPG